MLPKGRGMESQGFGLPRMVYDFCEMHDGWLTALLLWSWGWWEVGNLGDFLIGNEDKLLMLFHSVTALSCSANQQEICWYSLQSHVQLWKEAIFISKAILESINSLVKYLLPGMELEKIHFDFSFLCCGFVSLFLRKYHQNSILKRWNPGQRSPWDNWQENTNVIIMTLIDDHEWMNSFIWLILFNRYLLSAFSVRDVRDEGMSYISFCFGCCCRFGFLVSAEKFHFWGSVERRDVSHILSASEQ